MYNTNILNDIHYQLGTDNSKLKEINIMKERILEVLKNAEKPLRPGEIAAALGEERVTIEDVYEPYLIQMGLLNRTQKGRTVSDLAYSHLGIERVTE